MLYMTMKCKTSLEKVSTSLITWKLSLYILFIKIQILF